MDFLRKTWARIIVSLLAGGIIIELITMDSADPNHKVTPDRNSFYTMLLGTIIYFGLTALIKRNNNSVKR